MSNQYRNIPGWEYRVDPKSGTTGGGSGLIDPRAAQTDEVVKNLQTNWKQATGQRDPIVTADGHVLAPDAVNGYDPISEKNPLPWQRYFDPSIEKMAGEQLDRAGLNGRPEQYGSFLGGGLDERGPSMGATSDDPMTQAIGRKYQRDYGNKVQSFKSQLARESGVIGSSQLTRTANILGSVDRLKMQNFKEQYNYQVARQQALAQYLAARDAAKAAVWAGVLKLGGTIAGGAVAGPAGAAAGGGAVDAAT